MIGSTTLGIACRFNRSALVVRAFDSLSPLAATVPVQRCHRTNCDSECCRPIAGHHQSGCSVFAERKMFLAGPSGCLQKGKGTFTSKGFPTKLDRADHIRYNQPIGTTNHPPPPRSGLLERFDDIDRGYGRLTPGSPTSPQARG